MVFLRCDDDDDASSSRCWFFSSSSRFCCCCCCCCCCFLFFHQRQLIGVALTHIVLIQIIVQNQVTLPRIRIQALALDPPDPIRNRFEDRVLKLSRDDRFPEARKDSVEDREHELRDDVRQNADQAILLARKDQGLDVHRFDISICHPREQDMLFARNDRATNVRRKSVEILAGFRALEIRHSQNVVNRANRGSSGKD